jgi:hypothetical protein
VPGLKTGSYSPYFMKGAAINLLFSFLIFTFDVSGQKVQVLKGAVRWTKDQVDGFYFIGEKPDSSELIYVATLKAAGIEYGVSIQELYFSLKRKANSMGANGFKNVVYNEPNGTLQSDVYFLTDTVVKETVAFQHANNIFIFGRIKSSKKAHSFTLNGEKKAIQGGNYYRHVIQEGQEVKITKG